MAAYRRATTIATATAAPIGAGLLLTSTFLGRTTSTHAAPRFSSTAARTLVNSRSHISPLRTTDSIAAMSNRTVRTKPTAASPLSTSTATATATATKTKGGRGWMQWYESHLRSSPVRTKMATGSFLWGLGDSVAQVVPTLLPNDGSTGADASSASSSGLPFAYDWERTGRAVLFGFALHAPLSHVHFNFLEWMTVRGGFKGLGVTVFKTTMEQFVYWSWISNTLYHASMGALQGLTLPQIKTRISDVLWDTQTAQWAFWIPVQLVNFRFVPVRHQLNVVLVVSVVWTALLSAWYPPEVEGGEGTVGGSGVVGGGEIGEEEGLDRGEGTTTES